MHQPRAPIALIACEPARPFARRVAEHLGEPLLAARETWFACGEGKLEILANVRGCDVYVFQDVVSPGAERSLYDRLMMVLHAVEAAALSDAESITAVLPYYPGARQDKRKDRHREGISAGLVARMLETAGVRRVLVVEVHNEAIGGMFSPRVAQMENVYLTAPLARWLRNHGLSGDVVAAPDLGGLERARRYAEALGADLAALSKERDYSRPNTVTRASLLGHVQGRSVLLVDDIIDTAGSVLAAVEELKSHGATDVTVACVHPVLSGPAWERLHTLRARAEREGWNFRVVGTSCIRQEDAPDWYHSFPVESLVARVIQTINSRGSVTEAQRDPRC